MQCDLNICFPYQFAVKDSLNTYSTINIHLETNIRPFQSSTQGLLVWTPCSELSHVTVVLCLPLMASIIRLNEQVPGQTRSDSIGNLVPVCFYM